MNGDESDVSATASADAASTDADDEPTVVVRPLRHVENHAVVRRIGNRDLYLGNRLAAHPDRHDHDFDFVLSATSDEQPLTTHHHPLDDGPGNDWRTFAAAVDTARRLHRRDGTLLVHCTAGVSRSTTLVATALAAEEEWSLRDALAAVQDARQHAAPHPALHEQAVVYLAARSE